MEGAAWFGRCQFGDLIMLVDPRGLKAAAVGRLATPVLAEAGLSGLAGMLCTEATDGTSC